MGICGSGEGVARDLVEEAIRLGEDVTFMGDCDQGLRTDAAKIAVGIPSIPVKFLYYQLFILGNVASDRRTGK